MNFILQSRLIQTKNSKTLTCCFCNSFQKRNTVENLWRNQKVMFSFVERLIVQSRNP
eukprot:UN23746